MDVGDVRIIEKVLKGAEAQEEIDRLLGDAYFVHTRELRIRNMANIRGPPFEEPSGFFVREGEFVVDRRLGSGLSTSLPMGHEGIRDMRTEFVHVPGFRDFPHANCTRRGFTVARRWSAVRKALEARRSFGKRSAITVQPMAPTTSSARRRPPAVRTSQFPIDSKRARR
jgi:hypothetical protein